MKNQIVSIFLLIEQIAKEIAPAYGNDVTLCHQYAWWMMQAITNHNQAQLIAQESINLSDLQQAQLVSWIDKQVNHHEPLQYLLGTVPFGNLTIAVEPPTLIPRPETEEWAFHLLEQLNGGVKQEPLKILDLCTGSGCIGLFLASSLPGSHVWALDISHQAVALAQKNAKLNHIANITIFLSDLYTQLDPSLCFDLIVSNPPYIDEAQWGSLDASVTQWEDPRALIAPDNGLMIIKKIIAASPRHLKATSILRQKKIPQLWIEMDTNQAQSIAQLMHATGFNQTQTFVDLEGKDRAMSGGVV